MDILKLLLYALLAVFPLGVVARLPVFQSAYIYPIDGVVAFIFLVVLYRIITSKKNPFKIPLFKPLALFIGVAFISLVLNSFKLEVSELLVSFLYLVRFIAYSALLFVFHRLDEVAAKRFKLYLSLSGFTIVMLGFVQYFLYPNLRNLSYLGWDEHLYRMFSTLLDPNFAGAFFVLEFFLLLALFQEEKSRISRISFLYIVALLLTATALLLTYSRSSYGMFLVGGSAYFLFSRQKKLVFLLASMFFVGILVLPKNFGGEGVKLLRTSSIFARADAQRKAITIFANSPLFGVGFNAYRYAQKRYGFLEQGSWETTHAGAGVPNSFLFVLATTGIVGLLLYSYFWLNVFRKLYMKRRSLFRTAVIASILGVFVHSLFENSLFYPFLMIWLFVVIGVSMVDKKP